MSANLTEEECELLEAVKAERPYRAASLTSAAIRTVLFHLERTSNGDDSVPAARLVVHDTTITGVLHLRGAVLGTQLTFVGCAFPDPIDLLQAQLRGLLLHDCQAHSIDAANSITSFDVWLDDSTVHGFADFADARVGGSLHMTGTTFGREGNHDRGLRRLPESPLRLTRIQVAGSVLAASVTCHGMVELANAHIQGNLELDGARLHADSRAAFPATAVHGPNLTVDGSINADGEWGRRKHAIDIDVNAFYDVEDALTHRPVVRDDGDSYALQARGRLYLPGARIGADLDLSGADLWLCRRGPLLASAEAAGPNSDAATDPNAVLVLDRAHIAGNAELDHGFHAHGLVRLANADIGGDLRLENATLDGDSCGHAAPYLAEPSPEHSGADDAAAPRFYSLLADGVQVSGQIDGSHLVAIGEVRLRDSVIEHNIFLGDAVITAPGANAVNLERALIGGAVVAWRLNARGSVRLMHTSAGLVLLDGAHLSDPCVAGQSSPAEMVDEATDPVLNLIGAQIAGVVRCHTDTTASRADDHRRFTAYGSIFLQGAQVAGVVRLAQALVMSPGANAINAANLVAAGLDCPELSAQGAVVLAGAQLAGTVDLRGAHLTEPCVAANRWEKLSVDATSATIGGDLRMDHLFAAGLVKLRGSGVSQSVHLEAVSLGGRPASLDVAGLRTPHLVLRPAKNPAGWVDLSRAIVVSLIDNDRLWHADPGLDLLGLQYEILIDPERDDPAQTQASGRPTRDWIRRVDNLRRHRVLPATSTHSEGDVRSLSETVPMQPYLQLAAMYRAAGHEGIARQVLYRMRDRERDMRLTNARPARTAPGGFLRRLRRTLREPWYRLTSGIYKYTVGYGNLLHRAAFWLVGLWLIGVVVFTGANGIANPGDELHSYRNTAATAAHHLNPVPAEPDYGGTYIPALYAFDLLLPVIDLGQESMWHHQSALLQGVCALLQVSGWVLVAATATGALTLVGRSSSQT